MFLLACQVRVTVGVTGGGGGGGGGVRGGGRGVVRFDGILARTSTGQLLVQVDSADVTSPSRHHSGFLVLLYSGFIHSHFPSFFIPRPGFQLL